MSPSTPRMFALGALLSATLLPTTTARAQRTTKPGHLSILHQDLEPPLGKNSAQHTRRLLGPLPRPGQNPLAIVADSKLLPEPAKASTPTTQEPLYGTGEYAAARQRPWSPDRQTTADGTLHYSAVFNPSILPFKRMTARERVGSDFSVYTRSETLTDVPIASDKKPTHDLFWASMRVELTTGRDVPIPSLAPDMRIVSYEVDPPTTITFAKDDADNYFVRSDEAGLSGTHRLVFLADAPASYFTPVVPPELKVSDIPPDHTPPTLPNNVSRSAKRALQALGLHRALPLRSALDQLTHYFREFSAKTLPRVGTDIFWDLFANQAGACRHRSFAFTVVAQELGIPTRYVTNEAHAWVEVWAPQSGWMRIDLGGAARHLQAFNAAEKTLYEPRAQDPFPKPPSYRESSTQLAGTLTGLRSSQLAQTKPATAEKEGPIHWAAHQSTPDHKNRLSNQDNFALPSQATISKTSLAPTAAANRRSRYRAPPSPRQPLLLQITHVDAQGFRGEGFHVRGQLHAPVAGLPVAIDLAPAGYLGQEAVHVGATQTLSDGSFHLHTFLPRQLRLGDYEVFASTPGNARFAPARSPQ